ncbi:MULTISPECIES: leucine-rich repeat domain-containing protein [unclassified Ruminococcus]|uniref:leucine-rich repeat domain-containing protein n=1 Tax=unclassified Ruminococcus TaxID=2608920 RepID=UPI002108DC33|nr:MULTISPECIES: leucine-rich repeat domain-containing protein [unclassified Ruminococcus]MCQ4021611.1 leucine-rich repeat protein [Ruminococcus sp. zg-924]MCQ4114056.1 leucine-rich repeat protein [Ruminococcus sp. zg-921]
MKSKIILAALCTACSLLALSSLTSCSCSSSNEVDNTKIASSGYEKSTANELYKYDVFDNHICLTAYIGKEETINIPQEIDGKPVTEILSNTFYNIDENVKVVVIPKTVTYIESHSFTNNKLESIELDKDNPSYIIENAALMDKDKTILLAFPGKSSIEEFTIPSTVSSIPSGVFSGCTKLKKVKIPSSVKNIETFAFMGSGITQAELPEGVERIGMGVFWNCKNLETLTLPKSLKTIDNPETTCQNCPALKTVKGYDSTDAEEITKADGVTAKYESLGE